MVVVASALLLPLADPVRFADTHKIARDFCEKVNA
jgi:hypothetical protein